MPKRKAIPLAKSKDEIDFSKGSKADRERKLIGDGIHRDNPDISDEEKFRMATAAVKRRRLS